MEILSGAMLKKQRSPSFSKIQNGNLSNVCWSADGRYLYAGGKWRNKKGVRMIRRWSKGGKGKYRDFPASENDTLMHLLPLKRTGGIAFCSAGQEVGILDTAGRRSFFIGSPIADFRDSPRGLPVSYNGNVVQFGFTREGKNPALFSVTERTLVSLSADDKALMSSDVTSLNIKDWQNTPHPRLNNRPIKLDPGERSRSIAVAPDAASFLMGSSWHLYLFDSSGNEQWKNRLPGAAWAVNISGNKKLALAALGDGSVRWFRMSDGRELMALFPHRDGRRWVLWTPSGYYAASAGGEELVGWHVNRQEGSPDFFTAGKFRSVYYRPDVTARILTALDEKEALALADSESGGRRPKVDVKTMFPPVVTIVSPEDGTVVSDPRVTLKYSVRTPSGEPVTEVSVLVDGRPLSDRRGIRRKNPDRTESIDITLTQKECDVSVIAKNRYAAAKPARIRLVWEGGAAVEAADSAPRLLVLAIGVGKYDNPDIRLRFPAKDAGDFIRILKKQEGRFYRKIEARLLTDEKASKDGVLDGLDWMESQTTDKDVAMIFLAGHGVNDRNGDYYFLPVNGDPDRLRRTGVPYAVIRDVVSGLPGKVMLFADTCYSGNVMGSRKRGDMGDIDRVVNELGSAENGIVVFAASTGRQYALEDPGWGNGAFTKALVEGLSGKADYSKKGYITINMMDLYLSERVKELTGSRQTPTTAKPHTIPDFCIAVR